MKNLTTALLIFLIASSAIGAGTKHQSIKGNILRDKDYAFTLEKPSPDWQFLLEKDVSKLSPDAVAGIFNRVSKTFMVVIPEDFPDVKFEDYAGLLIENMGLENKNVTSKGDTEINGVKCYQFKLTGEVNRIKFTYVTTIYKRDGFVFQVISCALDSGSQKETQKIAAIQSAFKFIPGKMPKVRLIARDENIQGIGWRVNKGIYENAINGLKIKLPDGWKYMGSEELKSLNPDAAVGLSNPQSGNYASFIFERLGGLSMNEYEKFVLDNFKQTNNPENYRKVKLPGAETNLEHHFFENVLLGNIVMDYLLSIGTRGKFGVQVVNWWGHSKQEKAVNHLQDVYSAISWLSEAETQALRKNLLAAADIDRSVTKDESFRNNTYRNLSFGLSIKLPDGFWSHAIGTAARAQNEDAALIFVNLETELMATVVLEYSQEYDGSEYHSLILDLLELNADSETNVLTAGGLRLRSTRFSSTLGGAPLTYHLVTATRKGKHLQLLMYGLAGNLATTHELERDIIRGIAFTGEPIQEMVYDNRNSYTNRRLGFRINRPGRQWRVKDIAPVQVKNIGALFSIVKPKSKTDILEPEFSYVAGAIHLDVDGTSFLQNILTSAAGFKGKDYRLQSEEKIRWHGFPAMLQNYASSAGLLKSYASIRSTSVGGTFYFMIARTGKGLLASDPNPNVFQIIP
jgi:hypothetical protein